MATSDTATVISGLDRISTSKLVGLTVSDVRTDWEDIVNIPDGSNAAVNGEPVSDSYTLRAGDQLVFSRPVGSKG